MFPFWMNPCCTPNQASHHAYRQHQLDFLKWMRDSLETRLAAVNAAIATMERQMGDENPQTPAS